MNGSGPLYDELHRRFQAAIEPQPVHRFLASLAAAPPRARRSAPADRLDAYDLALERAFDEAAEEVDVVTYVASGPYRGKFWHRRARRGAAPDRRPDTYATELSLERRTVLLNLHGAVDRLPDREWESFVITEDDYIDYLGRSDVAVVGSRRARGPSPPESLPVPRVRDGRLEPPAGHATRLGRSPRRVPVVGRRSASRLRSSARSGAASTSTSSTSSPTPTSSCWPGASRSRHERRRRLYRGCRAVRRTPTSTPSTSSDASATRRSSSPT